MSQGDSDASDVRAILDNHSPIDPESQGAAYREKGWEAFDPDAPLYAPDTGVMRGRIGSRAN